MYDYERVKSSSRSIDGIRFKTKKREFISCNSFLAEAGTTGYKGGDSGHGARTFFSIKDTCCSDIYTNIVEAECGTGFEVRINGDTELDTVIEALKFIVQVLEEQKGEKVE